MAAYRTTMETRCRKINEKGKLFWKETLFIYNTVFLWNLSL